MQACKGVVKTNADINNILEEFDEKCVSLQ